MIARRYKDFAVYLGCTAGSLIDKAQSLANPEKAAGMQRFFKTGPDGYAKGDLFLGLPNPVCRDLIRPFTQMPLPELKKLLHDPYHEIRLCALLILVAQYARSGRTERAQIVRVYRHAAKKYINNWDLVDLSAPGIIGEHERFYGHSGMKELASSDVMWEQRIAIVSTLTLIRHGNLAVSLSLVPQFLTSKEDLIHKACGWILREVGKKDRNALTDFLRKYGPEMPRTMLRYAIEHYEKNERLQFLSRKKERC